MKKVAAHMAAAALLSAAGVQSVAQSVVLTNQYAGQAVQLNGNSTAGFLVTGDSRFDNAASVVTFGSATNQSLVYNFNTMGGSGSGGGAGLGGAFFVDAGASLIVQNTNFKSNRVQGGAGGSDPAVLFYDQTLNITGSSVDLASVLMNAQLPAPGLLRYESNQYKFKYVQIGSESSALVKKNSLAVFDDVYGVNNTVQVKNVSSQTVEFENDVVVSAANVVGIGRATADQNNWITGSGFVTADTTTTTVEVRYRQDGVDQAANVTDIDGLKSVAVGAKLVARTGSTVNKVATVTEVTYFSDAEDTAARANGKLRGKVKSITFDTPINAQTISNVDFLKAPSFESTQFYTAVDRKVVTVTSTLGTYKKDMTVYWDENGTQKEAKVLNVSGKTLTLDTAIPVGVTSIKAIENPVVGVNQIRVPNATTKFTPGQVIYVPGETSPGVLGVVFEGSVGSINGDVVTFIPKVTGESLNGFYEASVGLVVKLSSAKVAGDLRSIEVPFNTVNKSPAAIEAMLKNRKVDGTSFSEGTTVTGVQVVDEKTIRLILSTAALNSSVDYFKLYSPLTAGGNMNNLGATSDSSRNGGNGYSQNFVSSFFNDSEGQDGTNGAAAGNAINQRGFNGGNGGNGSMGLPVNFWLIYDLTAAAFSIVTASIDVGAAAADMAEAVVPDPVVGLAVELPDPLKIAAAALGITKANIDLAFAITDTALATANLTWWATQLGLGLAGLGGAGGDGGAASGGADFFGGGSGGRGGDGGSGAISISDGGDGGAGGSGGAGGFGAGGGMGGAGGSAGANGNPVGGDPGDGGLAGFGAGDGANGEGMFGGGGDGLGGSIFVRSGGTLRIQGNALFELNYVAGGSTSSAFGEAGYGAGTDLFMMKGSNVVLEPGLGKTIRFDGSIADDSASTDGSYQNAAGNGADITIQGNGGLVIFNGENTYSGNTILEGATLTALVGTGVHNDSLIRFNGAGLMTPIIDPASGRFNKVDSTMSLSSVGTFLLQEDYVRRAGTDPAETAWTGSGGFASGKALGELSVVNLGKLDDAGRGQALTWGRDGFFVPAESGRAGAGYSGVLTFGSEQSLGAVKFTNDVNLDSRVGRVAVYNTGNFDRSHATLSGQWRDGSLIVGDSSSSMVGDVRVSSPYNGTLFMTGENTLDALFVSGGVLSTYNAAGEAGKLFKSTADAFVLADIDNTGATSHLQLFSPETLRNMTVLQGGVLTLTEKLTALGGLTNLGRLNILGAPARDYEFTPEQVNALKLAYLPTEFDALNGEIDVANHFQNSSVVSQFGSVKVGSMTNTGIWQAIGSIQSDGNIENNNALLTVGNVDTGVNGSVVNTRSWTQGGNLTVGADLTNTSTAVGETLGMHVTGATDIGNNLFNQGRMVLVGNTSVGQDLTNTYTLNVTGDVVVGRDVLNTANSIMSITGNTSADRNLTNYADLTITGTSHRIGGHLTNSSTDADLAITGATEVVGNFTNDGRAAVTGNTTVGGFVSNTSAGEFSVTGNTMVTGDVVNGKTMTLTGAVNSVGGDLTNASNAVLRLTGTTANSVGGNLINAANGSLFITGASTTVAGVLTNSGGIKQTGNVVLTGSRGVSDTVGRVMQNGLWTLGSDSLLKAYDLVGNGLFCLSSSVGESACTGDAKNLTLELASVTEGSNFGGVFSGAGSLEKAGAGALHLSAEQTFTGGLLVSGGTVSVGGANGRMADTLDIVIGAGGTYISNNVDTVRSIVNNGNNSLVVNANLTTTQGVVNNGRTALSANLYSAQGLVNNGLVEVSSNSSRVLGLGIIPAEGITEVRAGLSGASTGNVRLGTNASLTVTQNGDTTYAGSINRVGADTTSSFFKDGLGTLSLEGGLNVKNITIDEGTLALNGANLVSQDAIVTINRTIEKTGTLQLVQGDQRFFSLNGAGNILLGSNNLTVVHGGDFTGEITGSGNVNVLTNLFRVNNVVSQAAFDVNAASQVDVAGTLSAASMNVSHGGTLKLGSPGTQAHLNVTGNVEVAGMLMGTGTVSGVTIFQDGGTLSPGQSPGILNFTNHVVLQGGSTTVMEVMNSTLAAGVGFDQLTFGRSLTIDSGATLNIQPWGVSGTDNINDRSLGLGEKIKLFDFAPGQITGVFSAANNTNTGLAILNLATGNAVGLGNSTLNAVAGQAKTDNEQAIYNGLNVSKNGSVAQFYGGQFIENLTAAMAAGTSTKAVFNAYNPESYFSLTDVGQEAAQLALPTWKSDLQGKDQFIAFAGNTTNSTKNDENRQSFGLKTNHTNIGVARDIGNRKSVVFTLAKINANTNSHTLQSSGNGLSAAAVLMGATDAMPNGVWHVGLTHSDIDMSGTRQNLNGGAKFNDIGVKTSQLDFGLETKHNFGSSYIMGRTSLALGSTSRAAINEVDYVNSLDKMSVEASRVSYKLWNIGMEVGTQLTSNTTMFGSLSFQTAGLNNKALTAGFDKNQARFSVSANSALSSTTKVMTGLRHKYADGKVFQASVGAGQSWERNTDVIGNVSLMIPF